MFSKQSNVPALGPLGVTVHVPLGVMLAPVLIKNESVTAPPVLLIGVKPVPDTAIWTPLGPWFGVSVIAGVVIVNGDCAESKLPSDPVAVTVYVPALPVVNAIPTTQLNVPGVPAKLEETTVAPQLPIVVPEEIVVVTVTAAPVLVVGVKPDPVTVTWIPLGPWVGESVMAGVVRVNEDRAESKLPSDPVAVRV